MNLKENSYTSLRETFVSTVVKFVNFLNFTRHTFRYKQMGCQGAINGISFTYHKECPDTRPTSAPIEQNEEKVEVEVENGNYPSKSTLEGDDFVVNDFSISTNRAQYLYFKTDGSRATVRKSIFPVYNPVVMN